MSRRGATLIELMVSLAILAIILTIAVATPVLIRTSAGACASPDSCIARSS